MLFRILRPVERAADARKPLMTTSSLVLAGIVGFVQGFVAYATTVTLSRKLAGLVLAAAREIHDPSGTDPQPSISFWIAQFLCFLALIILHIVVIEVALGALSQQDASVRFTLGRIALFALLAGLVVSRLLPEIEARLRGRKH